MKLKVKNFLAVFTICFVLPLFVASCSKDNSSNPTVPTPDDYIAQGTVLIQCQGLTTKKVQCKIKTLNLDGYCNYHRDQVGVDAPPAEQIEQVAEAVQCNGVTTKGERCKVKTKNADGFCNWHRSQAPE